MIQEKKWREFQDSGLLLFINQVLHAFGWAIVVETSDDNVRAYPARTRFRGFASENVAEAHKKIGKYLKDNIDDLYNESQE